MYKLILIIIYIFPLEAMEKVVLRKNEVSRFLCYYVKLSADVQAANTAGCVGEVQYWCWVEIMCLFLHIYI